MDSKLVRDRIPEIARENGDAMVVRLARDDGEFRLLLWRKLREEFRELLTADHSGVVDEMIDVVEVVYALAEAYGIDAPEFEARRDRKRAERGGFEKRVVWEGKL